MWLTIADALTAILAAAGTSIAVFGGFRVTLGTVVTADSAWRVFAAAVLLTVCRHYFRPRPTLVERVAGGIRAIAAAETTRDIAPAFFWSRLGLFLTAYLAVIAIGFPSAVAFRFSANEFANLPGRWDAGWYVEIAENGYRYDAATRGQQNVVFFPGYPLTVRAVGVLFGGHAEGLRARRANPMRLAWTGVLINLTAFAGALGYLYWMVRDFADREAAVAAVQFALAYPLAFVFNAAYSEGLFLLAAIGTFYHFGRAQHGAAATWGAIAGLTRPNGIVLCAPLALLALARSGPFPRLAPLMDRLNGPIHRPALLRDLATAMAPVAGLAAYAAFLYARWGDPLLWSRLQVAWGRTFGGLEPALLPFQRIADWGLEAYLVESRTEALQVLFFCVAIALAIPIAWRLGLAYTILILAMLLPPLVTGGWLSMARFTVVLFPLYVYLGVAVRRTHRPPVMIACAMLQALGAVLFFTWRPFY